MPAPVRINLHTAVSNAYSLAWDERNNDRPGYFNTTGAGGVFSHFYIRADGTVEQMQDTRYRSSCDLDGNPDTISIESWDGYKSGYPGYWTTDSDVPPWNAAQMEALVKLVRWIYTAHPTIPRTLATTNRRGYESRGLSYHRIGVPGYALYTQAEDGLYYTTSYKKGCPGNRRIAQVPQIHRAALTTAPEEEDDMPYTRDQMLEMMETAVSRQLWAPLIADRTDVGGSSVRNNLLHQSLTASTTLGVVRELAAREGVDVDEAAIASAVVAGITPQLRAAITDALKGVAGVDPRVVADAVVAKLGARLAA
jgi:hypothetical protein